MAVLLEIKVIPQSGQQKLVRDKAGILKCYLKSPPQGGKANDELVSFFSKKLSIPQADIRILQGATSRKKTLKFDTPLSKEAILERLGIVVQLTLGEK